MEAALAAQLSALTADAVTIQQIPAPTGSEHERAAFVYQKMVALGLSDIETDGDGNVVGRRPGRGRGPALAVTAHLDTVFDSATSLDVRRDNDRIYGPGIGDNSLGVAAMLSLAADDHSRFDRDVWYVANVCEEGLGNLRGMWTVMRRLEPHLGAVIVLEGGAYGTIIHRGIGVHRLRLTVRCDGGHAWSDYGAPSAVHELATLISALAALPLPTEPRSSLNVGIVRGGRSINTIAAWAEALLDLRSESPATLAALVDRVSVVLALHRREGVRIESEVIGERPAGTLDASHPLVLAAVNALQQVGNRRPALRAASTDANVPLALGLPAVCVGIASGFHAHRLDEYVDLATLPAGLQQVRLLRRDAISWLAG